MKLRKLRPSAAMIVACVALIAAIGGSAYAGSKINGNDIKRNTVTGKQVDESSLGTVPKAMNAKAVGGKKQKDLKTRWLLLDENGEIEDQSGGFTVIDATRRTATPTSTRATRWSERASRRRSRSRTRSAAATRPARPR